MSTSSEDQVDGAIASVVKKRLKFQDVKLNDGSEEATEVSLMPGIGSGHNDLEYLLEPQDNEDLFNDNYSDSGSPEFVAEYNRDEGENWILLLKNKVANKNQ